MHVDQRRNPLSVQICAMVLVVLGLAKPLTAEEPPDTTTDTAAIWSQVRERAQQLIQNSEDQQAALRQVLVELENFVKNHPDAEEVALVLFSHGGLAAAVGEYDTAEKSLKSAQQRTTDPQLQMAIRSELAKLSLRPGAPPPQFSAKSLDGSTITVSDYKGKVLLIEFWATWCGPCLAEHPNLKQVYDKYHEKGLEVVSISLDMNVSSLKSFLEEHESPWPQILNSSLEQGQDIATMYGVEGIPEMILVGRDGLIAATGLRGPSLKLEVKRALTADESDPTDQGRPEQASLGQTAPALAISEWLRGKPAMLDDLKGEVVLLDIFQIICPGCHRAHPEIVKMQKEFQPRGLKVLGVAVAFEYQEAQQPDRIRAYVDKQQFPYPVGIDKGLVTTFRRYNATGTPFAVLIDRQSKIRYLDFFRPDRIATLINQLLNEGPSPTEQEL